MCVACSLCQLAGPSSPTLNELQEQLNELNRLVEEELHKGAHRDRDLVAELRQERVSLLRLLPLEPIEDYGGACFRHKLRCASRNATPQFVPNIPYAMYPVGLEKRSSESLCSAPLITWRFMGWIPPGTGSVPSSTGPLM